MGDYMIRVSNIKIENSGNMGSQMMETSHIKMLLKGRIAKLLKVNENVISDPEIVRHSIDARKKPQIFDIYVADVMVLKGKESDVLKKSRCKNAESVKRVHYAFPESGSETIINRPVIIGSGPAGLFCAYELALNGYKPLVLERGSDVDERQKKVDEFWNGGKLDINCNVQFGEGGAGTFSDGKLNTVVKDKYGRATEVLNTFVKYGARENILYENKPHVGTDILRDVVKNMRNEIIRLGGEYRFNCQVQDLVMEEGNIKGVVTSDGETIESNIVVLAIGHSARDTFEMIKAHNIEMQQKAFAVGYRVEHRQSLINKSQYGIESPTSLPASPYKVVMNSESGRGVYSFCMCPGGYVVNASSEKGYTCVNGMSYNARDGLNANSAIIVAVRPEDFGSSDVLAGMYFQRDLEKKAYELGRGKVPVEYYKDFRRGVLGVSDDNRSVDSNDANKPQIKGEYVFANVHEILPDYLNKAFVEGMDKFDHMIKGFNSDDAIIDGVESRTSSPIRINRDDNLQSPSVSGLYPCGEGAGYAGGIMSAAMDGIKVAEVIAARFNKVLE